MKIWNKYLLLSLLIVAFTACTNLDEEVFSELTSDNFPTTEAQFISALGATYTSLYSVGNHNSYYSLNEISTDEAAIPHRGADWFDGGQWLRVHRHQYNSGEEAVKNGWVNLYGGVSNCNRVIELFETLVADGKVPAEQAAGFTAEVKVLRSYFYYWLLDLYGNVPLVTSFSDAPQNPANNSRQEVYDFIESELATNVPLLTQAKDGATYARFNYWAGKALQARLYLNAGVYTGTPQYQKALDACNEIIDANLYTLESDYFANFAEENAGSNENILVVPYDQSQAQGFNLAHMTLHYSSQATFGLTEQPWNGYCSLSDFYNSYDDADKRKGVSGDQTIRGNFVSGAQFDAAGIRLQDASAEPADPDGADLTFTPVLNELEPGAFRQAGARIGKYEFASGSTANLNNDFVLFRYAGILLDAAECQARLGNSGAALPLINQVRQRAGMADFGTITLDDLLAERGRELFFEGTRRPDLIRHGKWGAAWNFKAAHSNANLSIFPIPAEQIGANPNLTQNPGY
jgi:hypothetical protein